MPIIVRVIGGTPAYTMLANLPFHHSIRWRALTACLSPGLANLQSRHQAAAPSTGRMACRQEEAVLLDTWHTDTKMVDRVRRNAIEAFSTYLDLELHPRGVARYRHRHSHSSTAPPAPELSLPPPNTAPFCASLATF